MYHAGDRPLTSRRTLGVALLITVCGAATGLLVHHLLVATAPLPIPVYPSLDNPPRVDSRLQFAIPTGERFPDEPLTLADGSATTFHALAGGRPAVLLFWRFDCITCLEQAQLWNTYMVPALKREVKQLACISRKAEQENERHAYMLKGKIPVFVDYDRFVSAYNLVLMPTIIALDAEARILHIQYEFSPFFDEQLVRALTRVTSPDMRH